MTVASNHNKHVYIGNGATTEWPYSFPVIDKAHIKVYLTDTNGSITELASNYYINTDTNVVIYPGWEPGTEPPEELRPPILPAGWKITILRKVPIVQEIDLQNQGAFYAETIEQGLDKLTMIEQQLEEALSRAVQLPIDNTGGGDSLLAEILNTSAAAQSAQASAAVSAQIAQTAANAAQQYAESIEVVSAPEPNKILRLDENAKLPASITGDATTVDGKSPGTGANQILVLDGSGKVPQNNLPDIPVAKLPPSIMSSYKNKIINGNFDIWQRETSTVLAYALTYLADRWAYGAAEGMSGTVTVSKQSFTLGDTNIPDNALYFIRTQGSPWTSGTNGALFLHQRIESVTTFAGKKCVLSFWAKANSPFNLGFKAAQVFGSTGSPSPIVHFGFQEVSLNTNWQKFSIVIDVPSIQGKTITENNYLFIGFYFTAKGTNAIPGVTRGDLGSACVDIAQVQLEEGPVATPFEQRHIAQELMLCQRYYQVYDGLFNVYSTSSPQSADVNKHPFSVIMRTTPVPAFSFSSGTGANIVTTKYGWIQSGYHSTNAILTILRFDSEL